MISRFEVAVALDIPVEMAARHGIRTRISPEELEGLLENPPAWLIQSRANRTGNRPVWVTLQCCVCGFTESARPKKWWPEFTYLTCQTHQEHDVPPVLSGEAREEFEGVGSRFVGLLDTIS